MELFSIIIQTSLAITPIVIAFMSYRYWRKQEHIKRQIQHIEEMLDVVYEYVLLIQKPMGTLEFINAIFQELSQDTHAFSKERFAEKKKIINGHRDLSESMLEQLNHMARTYFKLIYLSRKGQFLRFEKYEKYYNSCTKLSRLYKHMESAASFFLMPNLNYENEEVQKSLEQSLSIKSDELKKKLWEHLDELEEWVDYTYKQLLNLKKISSVRLLRNIPPNTPTDL
jgi:hypothetical protein